MSTLFSHFFQNINHISPLEHNFTEVLDAIAVKPKTLYFYGKLPENMAKTAKKKTKLEHNIYNNSSQKTRTERPKVVAIVGSRHNTKYGEEVAYKLAYDLAKRSVVIVSGLAYGIDSIAHRGCLAAGGITVAVLGTPIDQIYPKAHQPLAKEIVQKNGAIISEYAPSGVFHPKTSFLERNRLISGLADIVVIVEAAARSGTLNTAAHALDQGKEVFAVPGNITSPYSEGCNRLIRQGASPYTCPDDIIKLLFPEEQIRKPQKQALLIGDTQEETIILKALSEGYRDGEKIVRDFGLSTAIFNETITILEIKGLVFSLGANQWALA